MTYYGWRSNETIEVTPFARRNLKPIFVTPESFWDVERPRASRNFVTDHPKAWKSRNSGYKWQKEVLQDYFKEPEYENVRLFGAALKDFE
jgi:hypothetical protein